MSDLALTPVLAALTPGTWTIDPSHSTVGFTARHLMVAKVHGRFGTFAGTIRIAEDRLASAVEATIEAASISTGDEQRDAHLRSADFLDVEQFPQLTFRSTSVRAEGDHYVVVGDLTIKDVTRQVELALELDGVQADPWGGTRAGFTAQTEINRKDFDLTWNVALETGGVLVGDKVKITLDIEAVKA
jgi:polyisoprenoid-binding protein YceI